MTARHDVMRLGSRQNLEKFRRAMHRIFFACLFELSSLIYSLSKHAKAWLLQKKNLTSQRYSFFFYTLQTRRSAAVEIIIIVINHVIVISYHPSRHAEAQLLLISEQSAL